MDAQMQAAIAASIQAAMASATAAIIQQLDDEFTAVNATSKEHDEAIAEQRDSLAQAIKTVNQMQAGGAGGAASSASAVSGSTRVGYSISAGILPNGATRGRVADKIEDSNPKLKFVGTFPRPVL
ncbi:unnamed protein product [Prorocentrum cordatum]|uniref:Uncharacterized protein n=1 Tax=Prorocentrum cordatum TaxID=2364126 RepID=A0ABN9TZ93_9DINO|nr:unnamed protein product [Polarella glacialis]